jgi:hypothetical protein
VVWQPEHLGAVSESWGLKPDGEMRTVDLLYDILRGAGGLGCDVEESTAACEQIRRVQQLTSSVCHT